MIYHYPSPIFICNSHLSSFLPYTLRIISAIKVSHMASSSSTRHQADGKNRRSFRTCIYPDKREIQICPKFRDAWIQYLREDFFGRLLYQDNEPIRVALFLYNNNCYMTDGQHVSNCLGFEKPTKVILTYEVVENRFKVIVMENENMENVSHHEENNEDMIAPTSPGSHQSFISVNGESDDDDPVFEPCNYVWYIDGCALPGFKNDRVFSWELPITKAYASSTKEQVLHIPQDSFKQVLRNRNAITIRTRHNADGVKCDLTTYRRKTGKEEMYASKGWFQFVRANNLKMGDKLQFQISNPPDVLVVDIVRRRIAL